MIFERLIYFFANSFKHPNKIEQQPYQKEGQDKINLLTILMIKMNKRVSTTVFNRSFSVESFLASLLLSVSFFFIISYLRGTLPSLDKTDLTINGISFLPMQCAIILITLASNALADWLSIAQTRAFIDFATKINSTKKLLLLAISDLFVTLHIFAVVFTVASFISFSLFNTYNTYTQDKDYFIGARVSESPDKTAGYTYDVIIKKGEMTGKEIKIDTHEKELSLNKAPISPLYLADSRYFLSSDIDFITLLLTSFLSTSMIYISMLSYFITSQVISPLMSRVSVIRTCYWRVFTKSRKVIAALLLLALLFSLKEMMNVPM